MEDFRRSWQRSGKEAQRLLRHFQLLEPHVVRNTLTLGCIRQLTFFLWKRISGFAQMIEAKTQSWEEFRSDLRELESKAVQLSVRSRIYGINDKHMKKNADDIALKQ
jgi:hypothetical protein